MIFESEHPVWGSVKQLASPVRVGDAAIPHHRAPLRGEHLQEITNLLGYTEEKIISLRNAGAFGE